MVPELIAGRYRVQDELGRGGMGLVLRAHDTRLHRTVALKMLRPEVMADSRLRGTLEAEARIASGFSHSNIAAVHDFIEDEGQVFIVYEFVHGRTLREDLAALGRFTSSQLLDAAVQLADPLAAAHERGIVHRDLKPENIMVTPAGEGRGNLKILDFGLAQFTANPGVNSDSAASEVTLTGTGSNLVVGTIPYMAPEQLQGRPADRRSDIYSTGLILFEMAAGRHPFRGSNPASTIANTLTHETPSLLDFDASIPAEYSRIVTKCLSKAPGERYQSATDLKVDLANLRSKPAPSLLLQRKFGERSLLQAVFRLAGSSPFRQWEVLHIRICIRSLVLIILTWKAFTYMPGGPGLVLSLSEAIVTTALYGLIFQLLYTGATDRMRLVREMPRLAPWIRAAAYVCGALSWALAIPISPSHEILAALLMILGLSIVVSILVFKPGIDRAALSELAGDGHTMHAGTASDSR